tara:strand:+ start:429 stop:536 length:108 start_codon:yes stop_codon:yes gene_type:complete
MVTRKSRLRDYATSHCKKIQRIARKIISFSVMLID